MNQLSTPCATCEVATTTETTTPIKVWCLAPDQLDHIRPVETAFGAGAGFVFDADCDPGRMIEETPDIAICVNEFPLPIAACLAAARAHRIPTLLLQDGILEWRCQYENPLFGAGGGPPQHQPVLSDKMACLGEQSARVIGWWGNEAKVEVTGMPRLDHLQCRSRSARRNPGRRVLVGTAKNPGFTAEQREITLRSLSDIASELEKRPDIEVMWRVPPGLAKQLRIENHLRAFSSQDFASAVEQADAFITTPSTSMIEAMTLERPVAALDYHNVPRFVSTAWTISAREQIGRVLDDLLRCPANKMDHQNFLLHDCLACRGSSALRVAELMRRMVKLSKDDCYRAGDPLPARILGAPSPEPVPERPSLGDLYPHQGIFKVSDLQALQTQVARLQKANERLRQQLQERSVSDLLLRTLRRVWRKGPRKV